MLMRGWMRPMNPSLPPVLTSTSYLQSCQQWPPNEASDDAARRRMAKTLVDCCDRSDRPEASRRPRRLAHNSHVRPALCPLRLPASRAPVQLWREASARHGARCGQPACHVQRQLVHERG